MSQTHFGPGPVLPPNDLWVKENLTAIVEATDGTNLDHAIDAFLSKEVHIVVNGAKTSREGFKKLFGLGGLETSATVKFDGSVQALDVEKSHNKHIVGAVGVFYETTIILKIDQSGAPGERKITSSLNVVVEEDPTLHRTNPEYFDGRRVSSVDLVYSETGIL